MDGRIVLNGELRGEQRAVACQAVARRERGDEARHLPELRLVGAGDLAQRIMAHIAVVFHQICQCPAL